MSPGNFWLRVLNVYPNEWHIVKRLYLFQFFQGAGIAFFFTSNFLLLNCHG
jgi:ATP:ADP antiporter, AAA family